METIKKVLEFFANSLNEFGFVAFFNKILEFFKIFFPGKDDGTTTTAA